MGSHEHHLYTVFVSLKNWNGDIQTSSALPPLRCRAAPGGAPGAAVGASGVQVLSQQQRTENSSWPQQEPRSGCPGAEGFRICFSI